jgi:thioesterase domain-containing protein
MTVSNHQRHPPRLPGVDNIEVQRARLWTRALEIANATRMVGGRHFEVIKPPPVIRGSLILASYFCCKKVENMSFIR